MELYEAFSRVKGHILAESRNSCIEEPSTYRNSSEYHRRLLLSVLLFKLADVHRGSYGLVVYKETKQDEAQKMPLEVRYPLEE